MITTRRFKILCVCEGGNSRSVGLAFLLKNMGHDALSSSWRFNSTSTLDMLYEWADVIILMQEAFREQIPLRYRDKIKVYDVGSDTYFRPSMELIGILSVMIGKDDSWPE